MSFFSGNSPSHRLLPRREEVVGSATQRERGAGRGNMWERGRLMDGNHGVAIGLICLGHPDRITFFPNSAVSRQWIQPECEKRRVTSGWVLRRGGAWRILRCGARHQKQAGYLESKQLLRSSATTLSTILLLIKNCCITTMGSKI